MVKNAELKNYQMKYMKEVCGEAVQYCGSPVEVLCGANVNKHCKYSCLITHVDVPQHNAFNECKWHIWSF